MPLASERRVVTVLFSDLSGFTGLSETMDPEDVRDVVDALFSRFRSVIESHGGTVDKYIGDAVMAVFGAPSARGDDPLRAVRAGLAMQRALATFNAERGLSLAMRVGVNTGEVLWGSVGGDARPTAMGDAVNVAQRLEGSAIPGTVLVSRATESASRRALRFLPRGEVVLRGRTESVEVFEAQELADGATEARELPVPLVGREVELAALWERLRRGNAAGVVVEGDAGAGKSRLVAEFRRQVREARFAEVLVGRCLESAPLPLAPFGEMVRGEAGGADAGRVVAALVHTLRPGSRSDIDAENAAHLVAVSTGLAVTGARTAGMEPAKIVPETRLAWAAWLRARAAGRPLLVVVEDLHWADEATRGLLGELPHLLAGVPALLLATSRPAGPPPDGWERTALADFPEASTALLAGAHLGAPPDPALARYLVEQTGGNPLAVEELARHLKAEGLVGGSPARLLRTPDRVPAGLHALLVARIDAVPGTAKEALKAASVLGREFWPALVAVLLGRDAAADLDEARRRELVIARSDSLLPGEPQRAFRHALLREAAYSLLPKKDRARMHLAAAEALESRVSTGGRRMRELAAPHREASGDPARAAALWLEAWREADTALAWEEALSCAREAKRLTNGGEAMRAEGLTLLNLGRSAEALTLATEFAARPAATPGDIARARSISGVACLRIGRFLECVAHTAAALATPTDPLTRVSASRNHAMALIRLNRIEEAGPAVASMAEAARELEASGGDARRAHAEAVWLNGCLLRESGFPDLAAPEFARVVEMRRPIGDATALSHALNTLGSAHADAGKKEEARACYIEALRLARSVASRSGIAQILNNLGLLLDRAEEHPEAIRSLEESIALKRELGDAWGAALTQLNLGALLLEDGRLPEAEDLLRQAEGILGESGDGANGPVAGAMRALAIALAGRMEEAAACARDAVLRAKTPVARTTGALNAALALSFAGKAAEALATLEAGIATARELGMLRQIQAGLRLRARLRAAEAPAAALQALDEADSIPASGTPRSSSLGVNVSLRARLRVATGDSTGARDLPPPPESIVDRVVWGIDRAAILALAGNKPEARLAAMEAARFAREHGLPGAAGGADALLKSLGD